MATERVIGNEGHRLRAAGILKAKAAIKENIWKNVSARAILAYSRLSAALYAGADASDKSFVEKESSTIQSAFEALGAHLQQTLVDRTMLIVLDLNRNNPYQEHDVELFPSGDDTKGMLAIDVLKAMPEKYKKVVLEADEYARGQVAMVVIEPDRLAKIGLFPPELYSSIIIGNENIVSVPTIIPGVSLRYRGVKGDKSRVVELVMEPL